MVDDFLRKRTRYCNHFDKNIGYSAYKRHKEEFYDSDNKKWAKSHATVEKDLDADDDKMICTALAASDTALPWPLLAGFHDVPCYKGHAHQLYDFYCHRNGLKLVSKS